MVLHDIAQRSGLLIERAAPLNTDALCRSDLNVIDIIAIPDRLKDSVCKAEDQDILYGLLAEVVIDAENLFLVENLVYLVIQFPGRFQIMSERFLDDDPSVAFLRMGHAMLAQKVDDVGEIF